MKVTIDARHIRWVTQDNIIRDPKHKKVTQVVIRNEGLLLHKEGDQGSEIKSDRIHKRLSGMQDKIRRLHQRRRLFEIFKTYQIICLFFLPCVSDSLLWNFSIHSCLSDKKLRYFANECKSRNHFCVLTNPFSLDFCFLFCLR